MEDHHLDEHDDEYLKGMEGRDRTPFSEDIFQRAVGDLKRRTWVVMEAEAMIITAAREMVAKRIGSVLVTENGKLAGILTERDLMNQMVEHPFDPKETTLGSLMTRNVQCLNPHDTVGHAIHQMSEGGYRRLPLVDKDKRPQGLVSVRDIVDYLAGLFPHQILTSPPDTSKIPENREGG